MPAGTINTFNVLTVPFLFLAVSVGGDRLSAPFDLSSLLIWIATGGGAAAIVSFIAYRWAWFQQQPPDRKALYILLATSVLAILAKLGIDLIPASAIQALAPYMAILIVIFTSWAASQAAYRFQRDADKNKPTEPPTVVAINTKAVGG